ncbi:hypothetical protein BC826DRAFT_387224 [Russula brevipes]|nr:hypothetical protein BC826DRAFT_387224 [Russula brevipes]
MSTESKLAPAPFDDAQADFVLRSSNNVPVDFHVSKAILSVASPVFAGMFDFPSQEPRDNTPVVTVSEDSEALDLSLRHIYPVRSPKVAHIHQVRKLAEFADKYQVEALEEVVMKHLANTVLSDPVGVYVIAVKYGYKGIGEVAARASLNIPFSKLRSQHLHYAPAELELLRYHAACGEAASAVAADRTWFPASNNGWLVIARCVSCKIQDSICSTPGKTQRGSSTRTRYGPKGLWNYLHRSAVVLAHHPTAGAVTTPDFILRGFDCPDCPSNTSQEMHGFSQSFEKKITKVIRQVPLPSSLGTR